MDIKDIDRDKLKELIADFVDQKKEEFSKNCERLYRELDWRWRGYTINGPEGELPTSEEIVKFLEEFKIGLFESIDSGRLYSNISSGGIALSYAVKGDITELGTVEISMSLTYEECQFYNTYSIMKK